MVRSVTLTGEVDTYVLPTRSNVGNNQLRNPMHDNAQSSRVRAICSHSSTERSVILFNCNQLMTTIDTFITIAEWREKINYYTTSTYYERFRIQCNMNKDIIFSILFYIVGLGLNISIYVRLIINFHHLRTAKYRYCTYILEII